MWKINAHTSEMSDARTFAFSAQTTLGMVLDDPTDVKSTF